MRFILVSLSFIVLTGTLSAQLIALHPINPHYFEYHGKPTILVTSAEHYGAVLNLNFDYVKYLDTLAADGLNLTRTFSGVYAEPEGAFGITRNTLAPKEGQLISPWARSDRPGYSHGGNKFDLEKWDTAYFKRLKDFLAQAGKRGIIVEFTLFCPMYDESEWKLSPMNSANNVNGVGSIGRNDVCTLDKNGPLLQVQEALVRKLVAELRDVDNLMYEICNEPYFGGITLAWQHRIADVIVDAEKDFAKKHLITQNIGNGSKKVEKPHPAVSVFNFHYTSPPVTVGINYGLGKVIGENETGFKGNGDDFYRQEAWEFLLAGGGLYNNLDYSFAVGHEDGTFQYPPKQPGGGNPGYRKQMKILKDFLYGFDFVKMKPARDLIREVLPKNGHCQLLAETGQQYAVYFKDCAKFAFTLDLPEGSYSIRWLDVVTGKELTAATLNHSGGNFNLQVPELGRECALRMVKTTR
ncbi:hypothetical protein KIH39_10215 [Telmatocola sphagniphila]|uniref:Glycoside hydrolase family 5 domain-containing protein n=1 Tax=Telmatocola sphagniphila TaxID=1123043 RepID=A0A8E6EWS0_9BACT|nr:hypothetical protein [Telmatocola sphagniphila]QVL34255.1 hypothetical protein KIH39_10215 [Telmatocola sphagniphila]